MPILIVVLVPAIAVAYLLFGSTGTSPAVPTTPANVAAQPAPPAPLPPAQLSLNNGNSLPQSVTTGELVPFSFTVANPSDQNVTYEYKVSVHWSGGEEDVIDENTLPLTSGASGIIQEQLKFEVATETAQVSLQLPQTGQHLEFSLPRAQ